MPDGRLQRTRDAYRPRSCECIALVLGASRMALGVRRACPVHPDRTVRRGDDAVYASRAMREAIVTSNSHSFRPADPTIGVVGYCIGTDWYEEPATT
jgi:hypothetical protein